MPHSMNTALSTFQFHKGTIKTTVLPSTLSTFAHFNSIKVRLKLIILQVFYHVLSNFNSIKVRLKLDPPSRWELPPKFQFHKGTIKTTLCNNHCLSLLHFNSIKVRLKLTSLSQVASNTRYFNSIKVRLKLHRGQCHSDILQNISIP